MRLPDPPTPDDAAAVRRQAAVPPAPEPSLVRRLWKAFAADRVRPEAPADDLAAAIALIERSDLFDRRWYLEHNPDVVAAGVDPAVHYLQFGGFEGRRPGPRFDSAAYLLDHLDAVERDAILRALELTRHNRTAAAKRLGISFRALRYRMQRLGIG